MGRQKKRRRPKTEPRTIIVRGEPSGRVIEVIENPQVVDWLLQAEDPDAVITQLYEEAVDKIHRSKPVDADTQTKEL